MEAQNYAIEALAMCLKGVKVIEDEGKIILMNELNLSFLFLYFMQIRKKKEEKKNLKM